MSDAPMTAEMPVTPKLEDLAKPAGVPIPPQPEVPSTPASPADARRVLEEIAGAPEREKVNALLSQGAQLLLDAGDPRGALVAVARSAAPTPLGSELRRDVLAMIADTKGEAFSTIRKDIEALNLPKTDPSRSEFANFLETYNRQHLGKAIPDAIIEAIRTKKIDSARAITDTLKTDTGLSAALWGELKGDSAQPVPNVGTPEGLLSAAGIEATLENTAKVQKLFEPKGPHPVAQLWHEMKSDLPSLLITTGMVTMLISQLVSQESGGGQH